MKRLIKFRGKRTDTGEWVFGDLIHGVGSKHGRMYILPVTHIYPKGCNDLDGWEVIPDTIGQFTGLLDKNGKEIYEGDAVVYGNHSGIIVYLDCYATFALQEEKGGITSHVYPLFRDDVEIIDNPELLKGGKE